MIILLFATFAAVRDANIDAKLLSDGLLYHGIDFHQAHGGLLPPESMVKHWQTGGFYLNSFSYVNSLTPNIASPGQNKGVWFSKKKHNAGIVLDPNHPDVCVHLINNQDSFTNRIKSKFNFSKHSPKNACNRDSSQWRDEKAFIQSVMHNSQYSKIMGKTYDVHFNWANTVYHPLASNPKQGFFNKINLVEKLKQNEASVNKGDWSEVVVSAPFKAVVGVIAWEYKNIDRTGELCKSVQKRLPNVPCLYKTNNWVWKDGLNYLPGSLNQLSVPDKMHQHGLLFHTTEFNLAGRTIEPIVDHWNEHGFYLNSFSFVDSKSQKTAGKLGILLDPLYPHLTIHAIAARNIGFNAIKGTTPKDASYHDACNPSSEFFNRERNTINNAMPSCSYANQCYKNYLRTGYEYFSNYNVIDYLKSNEELVFLPNWSEIVASAPLRSVQAVVKFEGASESRARTLCVELRRALQKKIPCYEMSSSWWRGATTHEIYSDEPIPPPKSKPIPPPKSKPKIETKTSGFLNLTLIDLLICMILFVF